MGSKRPQAVNEVQMTKGIPSDAFTDEDGKPFSHELKILEREDKKNRINVSTEEEKKKITKNVIVISLAFLCLFTSYQSMAFLQSSINPDIGTASLSVLYASMVISSAFLPTWLIKRCSLKYTMAFCMLGYSSYIAAQFYPIPQTLIPTAIILGLGAAPLWSAKCTYLTQVGSKYADLVGENSEVIITRFFGVFFLFFQSSGIWGNLISSLVLSVDAENITSNDERLQYCGAEFCPGVELGNVTLINEITNFQRYLMSGIYLCIALLASVIILLFVDPLSKFDHGEVQGSSTGKSGRQMLVATFHHMLHPYQILIIPLTIWSGVEQAFIGADFTAAFISCGIGVHMVGYVMIFYGICDATFSFCFTPLVKIVGRVPIFTFGAILNFCLITTLLIWMPNPDQLVVFFVIAGLWGTADAIWQTQINAFYGVIFSGQAEAAFSNYKLWESMGFIIAYVCSTLICVEIKIIILIVFLTVGIAGYYTIEVVDRKGLVKTKENEVIPINHLFKNKFG